MAVSTGPPEGALVAAVGTTLPDSAEGRGAALLDGPQGGELSAGESLRGTKLVSVPADELRQLQTLPPPAVRAGRHGFHGLRARTIQSVEWRGQRLELRFAQVKVAHGRRHAGVT